MFEYDRESMMAVEVLDKHDLSGVLKNCHGADVFDVSDAIDNLGNDEISEAITALSIDELVLYLERRYNMRCTEEIQYFLWWSSK